MIVAETPNSVILVCTLPPGFTVAEAEKAAEFNRNFTMTDGLPIHDGNSFLMEVIAE